VFDIGHRDAYFDEERNREMMRRVADKCYLPMNRLLLDFIERFQGRFRVAFSISGCAVSQFERFAPEVLASFQRLAQTGCVEFLAETSHHSLAFVFSREEFDRQVDQHMEMVERLFGQRPRVFRNTELIFRNDLAAHLEKRGFAAALAEGADRVLGWRSPNFVYRSATAHRLALLLKNYRLSDDIAFRFGDREWSEHPLMAEKFARWLNAVHGNGEVVNLFMDYETFGEHQWEDTGIFAFMEALPAELLRHPDNAFRTPAEVVDACRPAGEIDVPDFVSWADTERDLSAWLGNPMQWAASRALYALRDAVYRSEEPELLEVWQHLTTSDHLYYMCTKWFADGDVHKYFNPFESPYDAYIAFMNVLNDLALRLDLRGTRRIELEENWEESRLPGRVDREGAGHGA